MIGAIGVLSNHSSENMNNDRTHADALIMAPLIVQLLVVDILNTAQDRSPFWCFCTL